METLKKMRSDSYLVDESDRAMLRLDDTALWNAPSGGGDSLMVKAMKYAATTVSYFNITKTSTPAWEQAQANIKEKFMTDVGLIESDAGTIWNDMVKWRKNPSPAFESEASAAFASTVVLKNDVVRSYLMSIFSDSSVNGAFDKVSEYMMWGSYGKLTDVVDDVNEFPETLEDGSKNPKWLKRQRQIEMELAVRVARLHNGDLCKVPESRCVKNIATTGTLNEIIDADRSRGRQYATRFINAIEYPVNQPSDPKRQQPVGDYFSLRCAEQLSPKIVPRAGLQMIALKI
jgi:hypothetical protein